MEISFYQVDAFTNRVFGGNPAAICILDSWLPDETLQNIAAENNQSETAFLVHKYNNEFELRWFTPKVEIDLCGHATLASAFVIFSFIDTSLSTVLFYTASGILSVTKSEQMLSMDFPSRKPVPVEKTDILLRAFDYEPIEVLKARDLLVIFPNENIIKQIKPDFNALKEINDVFAVIISAKGTDTDFVSRFFAPNAGIPEDPVTGSAHCTLIPYWAEKLGKNKLHAMQLSKRGGELFCVNEINRVTISGNAVLYSKGVIHC